MQHVTIDAQAQTSVQPVHSENTDELFANDALVDNLPGDGETAPIESQIKPVDDNTCQPDEVQVKERDEDAPVPAVVFFFFFLFIFFYG